MNVASVCACVCVREREGWRVGCGEGGTSRGAVRRPGALKGLLLCSSVQGGARQPGLEEAHRLTRGEQPGQGSALPSGKQATVYSNVSLFACFNTHELCRHNMTSQQDNGRTRMGHYGFYRFQRPTYGDLRLPR